MRNLRLLAVALAVTAAPVSAAATPGDLARPRHDGHSTAKVGALNLRAKIRVISALGACSPMPAEAFLCAVRSGEANVPGLGSVSETYNWSTSLGPPFCGVDLAKPLATTARLIVAGRGELRLALAAGAQCVDLEPVRDEPQDFTITGGTGRFEGASGGGTVERVLSSGRGTETWTGTLVVPGLEFDLTPPTLHGATSMTVRVAKGVKTVRIVYKVTATDAVDGAVPVSCQPRSGSRFGIGRRTVRCSAMDKSGNTGTASFRVTVKGSR